MGQRTSNQASRRESSINATQGDIQHPTRLQKFLGLRIPGLRRQQAPYQPPAAYYEMKPLIAPEPIRLDNSVKVSEPTSFRPLKASAFNWDLDDMESLADDDVEVNIHGKEDSQMYIDPMDSFFMRPTEISGLKRPATKRKKPRTRDDSLFPRYPLRSLEARKQANLRRSLRIHGRAPPAGDHFLFSPNIVWSGDTIIEESVSSESDILQPPTSIDLSPVAGAQDQGGIQATVNELPVSITAISGETISGPGTTDAPIEGSENEISAMTIEETAAEDPEDVQVMVSTTTRYRTFAEGRERVGKLSTRGHWRAVACLFQSNLQTSTSTDNRYLSVIELLRLCNNETFVFNIVLYLRELAIRWNLHELSRHYFDPFFCPRSFLILETYSAENPRRR